MIDLGHWVMTDTAMDEPEDRRPGFTIQPNDRGLWVVQECCGLVEGEFTTQREALHFAFGELGRGRVLPAGFVHTPEPEQAQAADD
jgi:hypothetical protein